MNVFDRITASPQALADFLQAIPAINAPGQTCGYIVGIERFLPYVPAWCPKMGGCLRPPERYEVQKT